jgi:plastocyanin
MKRILGVILAVWMLGSASAASGGTISGKIRVSGSAAHADSVVYLETLKGTFPIPKKRPSMDHVDQKFVPAVLPVLKGTTVDFPNSDNVFHSAFSISDSNPFDLGIYGPGREKFVTFNKAGQVEIFCHIHDHMYGYVLVLENPYFDKAKEDGSFSISSIPPGTYEITAWVTPRLFTTQTITITGSDTVTMDITVQPQK